MFYPYPNISLIMFSIVYLWPMKYIKLHNKEHIVEFKMKVHVY
jgi:hypothetical protein